MYRNKTLHFHQILKYFGKIFLQIEVLLVMSDYAQLQ